MCNIQLLECLIFQLRRVIKNSDAIEQAKQLLQIHGQKALSALSTFTPSDARSALEKIVNAIVAV